MSWPSSVKVIRYVLLHVDSAPRESARDPYWSRPAVAVYMPSYNRGWHWISNSDRKPQVLGLGVLAAVSADILCVRFLGCSTPTVMVSKTLWLVLESTAESSGTCGW